MEHLLMRLTTDRVTNKGVVEIGSPAEGFARFAVEDVARICHETNRAYCQTLGDDSQTSWEQAEEWQRASAISGILFHVENPARGPADSHESWLEEKRSGGWKYGPVKDPEKKEHPCMVKYHELPVEQRRKDYLFTAIVHAFIECR